MESDYAFIIDNMTWSFSRLQSFEGCGYAWEQAYIEGNHGGDNFYGQYGGYVHKILEMYFKDELPLFGLSTYYQEHYLENVTFDAPPNKYKDIGAEYYQEGLDYFENFEGIDDQYKVEGVEKEIHFTVNGSPFVGYIDLLLSDKNGNLIVVDHKSAKLKFKKNGDISKSDEKHFDYFQKQLYLYSIAVHDEYGRYPIRLEWNLFRQRKILRIPFDESKYAQTWFWAADLITEISNTKEFLPSPDYFFCNYLCAYRDDVCPYKQIAFSKGEN